MRDAMRDQATTRAVQAGDPTKQGAAVAIDQQVFDILALEFDDLRYNSRKSIDDSRFPTPITADLHHLDRTRDVPLHILVEECANPLRNARDVSLIKGINDGTSD
jgi:hypothetical protein